MRATEQILDRAGADPMGDASGFGDDLRRLALEALQFTRRVVGFFDRSGSLVYCNEAFRELFDTDDAIDQLRSVIAQDEARDERGLIRATLADGRSVSVSTTTITEGVWISAEDITSCIEAARKASEEARHDPLTRLGNRILFNERLESVANAARVRGEAAALLIIDVDRFKAINDTLGHPMGDKLLCLIAERLRAATGPSDLAFRLGGDEFAIIQTGQPQPSAAAAMGGRTVDLLGRAYIVERHLMTVGASVGIAILPGDASEPGEAMRHADLALYRAKKAGRGSFRFFEPAMDVEMQARRGLQLDLRRAMALREFSLVYQPKFNLASSRVTGLEALLRWNSRKRGPVPPAVFIPLAEEIGLIGSLGEWVLRTACREAAGWPDTLTVAVNISAMQFEGGGLLQAVVSALAESGLPPHRLELEITESVLIGDEASTLETLHRLRGLGIGISMDDFGTGYSSLSYLRSFPFDTLKIDQSFVRASLGDPSGTAIIRAIATLGQCLGMATVAEGVETAEQLASIREQGCTDAQGYLIGKPLAPEDIADFLHSESRHQERNRA